VVDHHFRLRAGFCRRSRRTGSGPRGRFGSEAIARNPSATNDIRGSLLLGLVLIESLVIYVLLVSLILLFLKPFSA
jgi:F-type H+-transporting ATPase subunit c